jgi:hypothetical protein
MDKNKVTGIGNQFVDLIVLSYQGDITLISEYNTQMLFDLLTITGFDPKKVITKAEVCGSGYVPSFKVENAYGDDKYATSLLNALSNMVISGRRDYHKDKQSLAEDINEAIRKVIPLEPIKLTPYGDMLCEEDIRVQVNNPDFVLHAKHIQDSDLLRYSSIGKHQRCGSILDLRDVSESYNVITCRSCYLRLPITKEIKTYGELREATT